MPLQAMSPNGPSALRAPGPGGENAEGHQGLMPATQVSGTVNGILPPGKVGPVEASGGNPGGLAPSGLSQDA